MLIKNIHKETPEKLFDVAEAAVQSWLYIKTLDSRPIMPYNAAMISRSMNTKHKEVCGMRKNMMKRALIAAAVFAALSAAGAEEYFMGEGGKGLSVSVEKPKVQNRAKAQRVLSL